MVDTRQELQLACIILKFSTGRTEAQQCDTQERVG